MADFNYLQLIFLRLVDSLIFHEERWGVKISISWNEHFLVKVNLSDYKILLETCGILVEATSKNKPKTVLYF